MAGKTDVEAAGKAGKQALQKLTRRQLRWLQSWTCLRT